MIMSYSGDSMTGAPPKDSILPLRATLRPGLSWRAKKVLPNQTTERLPVSSPTIVRVAG